MNANDHRHMLHAARLALRGHGGAEPNPMVGCVIVAHEGAGQVVGWGYHCRCGGPHAEVEALRRAGPRAAHATLYCTLEPCNHIGRTGPCAQAIVAATISRVLIARIDPNPVSTGGVQRLRSAGIAVEIMENLPPLALAVSEPFAHRIRTGLPWVTVKWAQTLDGRIATRHGESKWISNAASRRMVHRERGRVDAILTGIGTVLHDDPLLTVRDVRMRRIARRVVIDLHLRLPLSSRLVTTAREVPVIIACDAALAESPQARALAAAGVRLMPIPPHGRELPLEPVLRTLVSDHGVSNVLVEAGPGLVTRLFRQNLVNDCWVFTAPKVLGDPQAPSIFTGYGEESLQERPSMRLLSLRRREGDTIAHYLVNANA